MDRRKPKYDLESLKNNVKREDKNIKLFTEEAEKAKERKAVLGELIQEIEGDRG